MKKVVVLAVAVAAIGLSEQALARPGQCYDGYGRPVGPVYDTDHPNYGFINSVIRRGGSCTGVSPNYDPYPRYRSHSYDDGPYRYHRGPRYDYGWGRRYRKRKEYDGPRDPHTGQQYPHTGKPGLGSCVFPDVTRCNEAQTAPGH